VQSTGRPSGQEAAGPEAVSPSTAREIDHQVRAIIDRNYARARGILEGNLDKLHLMAEALVKYETLDSDQITDIMEGRVPREPQGWDDEDRGSSVPPAASETGKTTAEGPGGPIGGPAPSQG
jgi:cell division protease FtsH